ncbi:hypothetical protein NQ318_006369 [Aromia moschata]|uniref:Mos1 transposase HTH domain-containing protein n=1 Tax=Aromia moschata TaxID=1265417 RepID=A0AAV8YJ55_9CUCU|nr:hypothetical protein NQ318_006369 [Aromia moschata]
MLSFNLVPAPSEPAANISAFSRTRTNRLVKFSEITCDDPEPVLTNPRLTKFDASEASMLLASNPLKIIFIITQCPTLIMKLEIYGLSLQELLMVLDAVRNILLSRDGMAYHCAYAGSGALSGRVNAVRSTEFYSAKPCVAAHVSGPYKLLNKRTKNHNTDEVSIDVLEPQLRCLVTLRDEPFIRAAFAVKFCFKQSVKTACETHEMIKSAYEDDTMDRSSVFEWHKLFRQGREKVEDDQRSGQPSTIKNDENIKPFIL